MSVLLFLEENEVMLCNQKQLESVPIPPNFDCLTTTEDVLQFAPLNYPPPSENNWEDDTYSSLNHGLPEILMTTVLAKLNASRNTGRDFAECDSCSPIDASTRHSSLKVFSMRK